MQWLEEEELEDVAELEEGLESECRRKRLTAWTVIWISLFIFLTHCFILVLNYPQASKRSQYFAISELENGQS